MWLYGDYRAKSCCFFVFFCFVLFLPYIFTQNEWAEAMQIDFSSLGTRLNILWAGDSFEFIWNLHLCLMFNTFWQLCEKRTGKKQKSWRVEWMHLITSLWSAHHCICSLKTQLTEMHQSNGGKLECRSETFFHSCFFVFFLQYLLGVVKGSKRLCSGKQTD